MNERLLAEICGPTLCRRELGAVQWCLTGTEVATGVALEVLLSGAAATQLPPQFTAVAIYQVDGPAGARWELRSSGQTLPLEVRAVQVHRLVGAAFASALPQKQAPAISRAGWTLLLNLLRVPGMARLLKTLTSRGNE